MKNRILGKINFSFGSSLKKKVPQIYDKLVEVSMVVGFFKKMFFFHLWSIFIDSSNFESLIFPNNLFDFESKFPFVA